MVSSEQSRHGGSVGLKIIGIVPTAVGATKIIISLECCPAQRHRRTENFPRCPTALAWPSHDHVNCQLVALRQSFGFARCLTSSILSGPVASFRNVTEQSVALTCPLVHFPAGVRVLGQSVRCLQRG